MVQVANIILDTKKTGVSSNKIIELRVCDNTDQIVAQILLNGQPRTDITSATFFAEKPDKSIIANDPANIDGSFVSYSIPKELTAVSGHITKAYFYINGTLSTDNFEILIEESVDVNGDPIDYIPGLAGLQKIWDTTKNNWETKINDISAGIDSFDTDQAVKDSINKAIEKAKNDSMTTLDQAIKSLNDKKSEAETTGADLDTEVTKLKAKIVDVDSLIADTQAQILAANDSFTKDQQTKVDKAIAAMTSSMESAQSDINGIKDKVASIQTAVDALDIPKINADTATALANSKDAKDAVANKIDGATLNGTDVAVKDGKLDINVADPDMSEYATNDSVDGKLGDYSKSADIAKNYAKKGDIPANALTLWKGSADDYAALTDKADNTEYNIVDDTGIKNIYVGSSEIYKRGIPEGTVIYENDNYWDETTQNFKTPLKYGSGNGFKLKDGFSFDDIKNGIALGINDSLFTNNTSYPRIMYHNNLNYDGISQPIAGDTKSSGMVFIHLDWNNILAMNSVTGRYPECNIGEIQTKDSGTNCWLDKKDGSTDVNAKWSGNNWFRPKIIFYNTGDNFTFNLENNTTIIPSGSTQKVSIHPYPVLNKIIAY